MQYDDSAFFFFALAILTVILIPLIVNIVRSYFKLFSVNKGHLHICKCETCQSKVFLIKKLRTFPKSILLKIALAAVLSFLIWKCAVQVHSNSSLKTFDPYEIMDISPTAGIDEIKSKFKKLAKKLHPDLNPGDPDAHQKFFLLTKAYSCLTDQNTKENCEKFGSPDGHQGSFQVGIALPNFLLKKENKAVILGIFFIFMLIVVPYITFLFYENSDALDSNGISKSNYPLFIDLIRKDNIIFKNFIEVISLSKEVESLRETKPDQIQALEKIRDHEFVPQMGLQKFKPFLKVFYLLHAYMIQKEIPPEL